MDPFNYLCFVFVCHTVLSVPCCLTLVLLCVMFSCVLVTFPCGFLGQVWYSIVSIADVCLRTFFVVTYWERADHLVLLYVMCFCFGHFPIWCPGLGVDCIDS